LRVLLRECRALVGAVAIGGRTLHAVVPSEVESKEALHLEGDRREEAVAMIGEITARVIASIEREVASIEVVGAQGLEGFVTVSNRGEPKVEPLREASIFGEASVLGGE
jgi:hypothetical protein